MVKKKIKLVIFDLGGVLMHAGYLDFVRHYVKGAMSGKGKKELEKLERDVNLGRISETDFYHKIQKVFDVHLSPKQMHRVITKGMSTDKGLVHLIPHLKKAKVALFTNSIGHMAVDILKERKIPVNKLFDKLFISSNMHMAKPDGDAYRFVLKKFKVKPSEAMMVDDRPENINPAKKIGMNGVVYRNSRQLKKELQKYQLV